MRILFCSKNYGAEASGAAVWPKGHISSDNGARLAEEVLEILPLDMEWEL